MVTGLPWLHENEEGLEGEEDWHVTSRLSRVNKTAIDRLGKRNMVKIVVEYNEMCVQVGCLSLVGHGRVDDKDHTEYMYLGFIVFIDSSVGCCGIP